MRLLLIAIICCVGLSGFAQDSDNQSLLWKVSGGDLQGSSYLLGTLPVQDSTFFRFPDRMWTYLDKTDVFLHLPESELSGTPAQLRALSFKGLSKHYAVTPNTYLKQLAVGQLKPVVDIDEELGYASVAAGKSLSTHLATLKTTQADLLEALSYNYFSGKYQAAAEQRLQLDVPQKIYQELVSRNNYLVLNKMIEQMRLQPVFFPVDMIRLSGNEGLISLLRARGYKVKPAEKKFYLDNEKALIALQNAAPPPPPISPTNTTATTTSTPTTQTPTVQPSELSLPMEILNLKEWSEYAVEDSLILVSLPGRPRNVLENEQLKRYEHIASGLTYTIEVSPSVGGNLSSVVDQMIIRSGGQLVKSENAALNNVNGRYVELMYLENTVSRHYLLPALGKLYNISVKGSTPQIFSEVAEKYFQTFTFTSTFVSPTLVTDVPNAPEVNLWHPFKEQNLSLSFPKAPERKTQQLENGTELTTYALTELIGGNKYVLAINKKDAFDNFQLFNSSINTATTHLKGVIVKQDVMPEGRNYFAEYLVKDPIGNHYRIAYYYDGTYLYQVIIKGDRKSVNNSDANQVMNSIFLSQFVQ
ncbi:MAG: TraB/GumN family protein [Saprospiraceae bacterium]|nr:TraB/GumN family protein [Saprospiraceae bacterium]